MKARTHESAAGFTLVEVIVASVLLLMMITAVATLSVSGMEAQDYAARLNRTTEIDQALLDKMRLEIVSSVRMFGNDTEGNANLGVLDLGGAPARLAGSRLPTISATGSIQKDTSSSQITGNSLFFAKLAWTDRYRCHSGTEYLVDVYRWMYYYMTPEGGGPTSGSATGLNLVCVTSEPLIDAAGIDRITDTTDSEEVLQHLHDATPDALGVTHLPCEVVWERGALPSVVGTLRQINPTNWRLVDDPLVGRPDPWKVLRNDSDFVSLLSYRHHSVATNFARPAFGVGKYGYVSTAGAGFPHGFEIQIVGPSSARQVLLHLVLASTNRRGQIAWSDMRVVVDGREL